MEKNTFSSKAILLALAGMLWNYLASKGWLPDGLEKAEFIQFVNWIIAFGVLGAMRLSKSSLKLTSKNFKIFG